MQGIILEAYQASSLRKIQVRRLMPSIEPRSLYRYLDGDRGVYLRERTAERLLSVLRSGPQGPKESKQ